jgi:ribosomal protein L11 methyltransferase
VLAELVELAPAGFEQIDGDGWVEFALYGAPGELPALPSGPAELAGIPIEVAGHEIGGDWADRWREFHKPAQVGDIHIRAPWHQPAAQEIEIVIDPGQAFGTGAHPTTRMCLELLQEVTGCASPAAGAQGGLADLGCGSGVLAIAAAKLGFSPVVAVDNEQAAVEAAVGNATANGVTLDRVERCDLRTEPAPVERVTVANLVGPLLLRVAELWREQAEVLPERPETLIVSGLLEHEADEVAAAFAPLEERKRLTSLGWSALLLS